MPMTIKITEGVVPTDAEPKMAADLTAAFLAVNGATGNPFLTPNFPVIIITIPAAKCYLGGERARIAQVELRVPSFALTELNAKKAWVEAATDIIRRNAGDRLPPENIWVNMVYGDDMWGVGGTLYTDATLKAAIEAAA